MQFFFFFVCVCVCVWKSRGSFEPPKNSVAPPMDNNKKLNIYHHVSHPHKPLCPVLSKLINLFGTLILSFNFFKNIYIIFYHIYIYISVLFQ